MDELEREASLQETDDFIVDSLSRPIQLLYQDEFLVAAFKPAGLITHRSKLTLPHEPVLLQSVRDQLNQFVYPIHRLDRPTAGIVLFALSSEAAARFTRLFASREISKYYQAIVRGFTESKFVVDRPLQDKFGEDWDEGSTANHPMQSAETEFVRLETFELDWPMNQFPTSRYSLLEIKPITGRWHQIRRHLNHVSNPVIGDHRHGDHRHNQLVYSKTGIYRMLLTALRLDFRHPFTDQLITIHSGRGSEFDRVVDYMRTNNMNGGAT